MILLLVEDHSAMRKFIKAILADLAEHMEECEDGAAALGAYAALRPDWVVMDIQMPEMDGLSASRQILAQYPEARICIVTNHADSMTRAMAQRIGVSAFVSKANLVELRETLQQGA